MKNFIQEGKRLTWTNGTGADVTAGTVVVIGTLLAVACVDIANGAKGACAVGAVFEIPKTAHASSQAIAQGEKIAWDLSAGKVVNAATTLATGDISGNLVAWEAAASTATTVKAFICPIPGTVTA